MSTPRVSNLAYNIGMVIGAMRAGKQYHKPLTEPELYLASGQFDAEMAHVETTADDEWVVVSEERSVVVPLTANDIVEGGVYVPMQMQAVGEPVNWVVHAVSPDRRLVVWCREDHNPEDIQSADLLTDFLSRVVRRVK